MRSVIFPGGGQGVLGGVQVGGGSGWGGRLGQTGKGGMGGKGGAHTGKGERLQGGWVREPAGNRLRLALASIGGGLAEAGNDKCSCQCLRAARVQNEIAPEKLLNRYEKRFEKCEKGTEKTIRNAFEKFLAPLRPLKNISPPFFTKF